MFCSFVRNVNDLYPRALRYIVAYGESQSSRAGEVIALTEPMAVTYTNPQERVLFDEQRDANWAFHLFEALWMLAGRNDATWLDQFISDFSQRFAEPDGHQHGAYGHRWRKHFDLEGGGTPGLPDQLETVVRKLQLDPTDRRVVIQMWDPVADLGADKRDVPCLAGDTVMWSPEGNLEIAELARRFSAGEVLRWPVFSVDTKTWTLRLAWCTNVWKSGKKKTLRLTFDDGSSVRATADHKFYRRLPGQKHANVAKVSLSEEVSAGALRVGDRIVATQLWELGGRYLSFKRDLTQNTNYGNMVSVRREYWNLLAGNLPDGFVVHHKNENKHDNRLVNLAAFSKSEHDRFHRLGDRNPMRNLSPEQHRRRAEKQAASLRAFYAALSPEERAAYPTGGRGHRKGKDSEEIVNHRIIDIEPCPPEEVYDFTVPGEHTALIGTGVLTHNCNLVAVPRIARGQLDLTVFNRSNDFCWGLAGANAVHFSVLQEYLAGRIGIMPGQYNQITTNAHVYKSILPKLGTPEVFTGNYPTPTPIGNNWRHWDRDLRVFMDWANLDTWEQQPPTYPDNPWFEHTAQPLYAVHATWKQGRRQEALELLLDPVFDGCSPDWRLAAQRWMERRINKKKEEAHGG